MAVETPAWAGRQGLLQVAMERGRLFQRVEVLALHVLDDRQLGHLPVVGLDHLHRRETGRVQEQHLAAEHAR